MQTPIYIWLYAIAFVQLQTVSLSAQDASSCTENIQISDHQHPASDKIYNRSSNAKTPGSQNAISTIPNASPDRPSAPKSGKFQVNTHVHSNKRSISIPEPTVVNSIGDYALGGEGIIHVASYNCDSNPKNVVSGYCVLTIPDALIQCNSDPNCGGIEVTTNVGWHNAYDVNGQTVVQLFAVGSATNPNAEWNYFNKNQEIVVESIEDDAC
ncbi:unnamed protein product [Rotaria socialis]|uniref:Uncharacterized protein n=1 Tax=Rotaria socialis TaxID=392032 RepID=A0A818ZCU4_9BILA|nr:unnamed protein product [Rotaria socialis]